VCKMEDEAVVMMYCKKDNLLKKIKSYTRYLSVSRTNTDGLLLCLRKVLKQTMGIQEPSSVLQVSPY